MELEELDLKKIFLPWPENAKLTQDILKRLEGAALLEQYHPTNQDEYIKRIKDVDILIAPQSERLNKKIINAGNKLKMIQVFNVGYENIDVKSATNRGVIICNIAEVNAESVAEMTWALILTLCRNVAKADNSMRKGEWKKTPYYESDLVGVELWGKTIGVIGLGAVGARVAMKGGLAFSMRVLTYDPYVSKERAQMFGADHVDLQTLLKQSDIVSINCPLTKETYHMIGEKELSMMKDTAILVNTARGPIIDEKELIKSLRSGAIKAAGLDVYEEEPLDKNSPLRELDNVILTPHLASVTDVVSRIVEEGVQNILSFIEGSIPKRIVNPEVLKTIEKQDSKERKDNRA